MNLCLHNATWERRRLARGEKPLFVKDAFNPDQPRDPKGTETGGQWTAAGSEKKGTEAFKQWFGKSKVVDEDGKPLIVHHGSNADFEEFNTGKPIWFSSDSDLSLRYARMQEEFRGGERKTYDVFLRIERPLLLSFDMNERLSYGDIREKTGLAIRADDGDDEVYEDDERKVAHRFKASEIVNTLKFAALVRAAGYDGIKVSEGGVKTFAVFESSQVKLARHNYNFNFLSAKITDAFHTNLDPTGTTQLRNRFWRDMRSRWLRAERLVTEGMKTYDMLGVGDRVSMFQHWLESLLAQSVLGDGRWMTPYLDEASAMAGERASGRVKDAYNPDQPRISRLQLLNHTAVAELQGVIAATVQQSVRAVSNGILARKTPAKVTRDIVAVMKSVGERRSRMVSDYMVVKTFAAATLEAFRARGVTRVGLIPERVPAISVGDAFDPDQPRDPKGTETGGQWTGSSTEEGDLIVYHGTVTEYLSKIEKHGLVIKKRNRNFDNSFYDDDRGNSIFVANNLNTAVFYAQYAQTLKRGKIIAYKGEQYLKSAPVTELMKLQPVVFEVHIPRSEASKLRSDERTLSLTGGPVTSFYLPENIPPQWIKATYTKGADWERHKLRDAEPDVVIFIATLVKDNSVHVSVGDAARKIPQKRHRRSGQFTAFAKPISSYKQRKAEKAYRELEQSAPEVNVLTAEDDRVCQTCEDIADAGPYDIDEALSLIPAHINCRCIFIESEEEQIHDFDPNQPRDHAGTPTGGQWTSTGTEAGGLSKRRDVPGSEERLAAQGRPDLTTPLSGLPRVVVIPGVGTIEAGPFAPARQAAYDYAAKAGIDYHPPTDYVKVDPERATRIADEYDKMKDDPDDPEVKAAYDAMIKETIAQYREIEKTGLDIDWIDLAKTGDPYAKSPRQATEDVRNNNHLWVFPTLAGFGSDEKFDISKNPLLADSGIVVKGYRMTANDVFRIVHDYFGHIKEGNGFRADGEENAWRSHSTMYSPLARRAMTSETRGQNSWVNYGPFGAENRSANSAVTHFADQKAGLLPWWVSDGRIVYDAFNPNQPRDPKGTETGGQWAASPGVDLKRYDDFNRGIRLEAKAKIRQKIDQAAEELGYPKEKIFMSDKDYRFQLNGQNYKAAGVAFTTNSGTIGNAGFNDLGPDSEQYDKGDIVIFGNPGFDKDFPVRGTVAHEIEHQKFQTVLDQYGEESAAALKEHIDIDEKLDKAATRKERTNAGVFKVSGEMKPEYESKYPTYAAVYKLLNMRDLAKDDGVSDYSRQYWAGWEKGEVKSDIAVHETLAEIARIKDDLQIKKGQILSKENDFTAVERPSKYSEPVAIIWQKLFEAVDDQYERLRKRNA